MNTIKVKIGNYEVRDNAIDGKKELLCIASQTVIEDLELAKLIGTQALEAWWDTRCIDVSGVGMLPLESAFNAQSTTSALVLGVDAAVVDINDVTIVIPSAALREKVLEFRAEVKACMDAWDRVLASIKAATTIEEIIALNPSEPIVSASATTESSGPRRFRK
jgi:hypothetical protein